MGRKRTTRSAELSWCLKDFLWFVEGGRRNGADWNGLPNPDGEPIVLEPYLRLILFFVFRAGLVELLVLIPKGQGKTTLFAALAVFHLLVTRNAQCFILAADAEQAGEMYRFAQHFVESSPSLMRRLLVRESTKRILRKADQGFIRVLASDNTKQAGKRHSYNPTLALIDELHAHANENAYVAMRSAAFKRGGIVLNCTTAGHDEESTLGKLRAGMLKFAEQGGSVGRGLLVNADATPVKHRDGRLTVCEAKSGRTAMLEWACRQDDDLADPEVVKLANPSSRVTVDGLADALEAPGITPWQFARYRANVWTRGFASWLPEGSWAKLAIGRFRDDPYEWVTDRRRLCLKASPRLGVEDGDDIFTFVDMARYRDTAAVTVVAPRENEPPRVWLAFVEKSGGIDAPVPYGPVKDALRELDGRYRLLAAGYDPKYFDQAAEELEGESLPMVNFPQTNERMCPASANFRQAVLEGRFAHDGDPILEAHVMAGAAKDVGHDAFRVVRQKGGGDVDALVAGVGAHQLAFFRPGPTPFIFEVFS